ncbi:four-carbon acid sugar kinase family protein [Georgenia halophila]|uniref:Four-carbon acid sugar kinase family protein n=1 Tax=Georgenia halophila TaxID=620889 RepID=A0ABP8LPD4_9MICO
MPDLRVAFYGDDFTGSVDALLQFARAGWRGRLFVGHPGPDALVRDAAGADVIGIAGVARSLSADAIDEEVRPALEGLRRLHPAVVQYKACSTADSSPTVGSLGRVIEIGRKVFGPLTVPVLVAQPDFGRYTVFGHHFAAEEGIVYRLDRQPTMSNHPVTPMHEADLARHLSRQTALPIGSLDFTAYADAAATSRTLRDRTDAATVLDAMDDRHVALVGRAVAAMHQDEPVLAIGSGGLSAGLAHALTPAADGAPGNAPDGATGHETPSVVGAGLGTAGPVLAVSGSRSPQTARQVAHAVEHGWTELDLPVGSGPFEDVTSSALDELAAGRSVVVSTVRAQVEGADDLVERIAVGLAAVVRAALVSGTTRRVVVCGGDTSSRVVTLLGAESLEIAANPFGNVVVCRVSAPESWLDGADVLLKGGQVGPVDLFETVRRLDATAASRPGRGGPSTSVQR